MATVAKTKAPAKKAPTKPATKTGPFGRPAGTAKKTVRKKKPLPQVTAPEGMRPQFILGQVRTAKDGLFGSAKFVRYLGRFDFQVEEKKKRDLSDYDSATAMQIFGRLASTTYKSTTNTMSANPKERLTHKGAARLPPSTTFLVLIRATVRRADQTVAARIAKVWQIAKNKAGKAAPFELPKNDPAYRLVRRASRILPPAFAAVQEPPKLRRGKPIEVEE